MGRSKGSRGVILERRRKQGNTGGIKDWTFRMISGLRERNIWISTPRQRKLMNCEGRLIGWSMMVMPPFSHFPFFVSNGPCCPLFFSLTLVIFFSFPFIFIFAAVVFSYFLSSRFCLFAVAFSLALQSDLPLAIFQILRYLVRYTDCYSSLNLSSFFFSPPFSFLKFVLSPLVNVCVLCLVFRLGYATKGCLRNDSTRTSTTCRVYVRVLMDESQSRYFGVYRYSSTTIRIIVSLSNR
ncbi:hypothetical protein J3E69DRAFT_317628 [Trichoderma sp. SZMC 28015]